MRRKIYSAFSPAADLMDYTVIVSFATYVGSEEEFHVFAANEEDASEEEDGIEIITAQTELMKVRQALIDAGMTVTSAELKYVPTTTVPVGGEDEEKVSKLLEAIDDLDDVVNVFTNAA